MVLKYYTLAEHLEPQCGVSEGCLEVVLTQRQHPTAFACKALADKEETLM